MSCLLDQLVNELTGRSNRFGWAEIG